MIPAHPEVTVEGNLDGNKIAMSLDENATAHLMSVLTDLYSDPEAAVIREYSVNARDSHTEAGQTRPIEVQTPGTFSQDFIVRDFGIGLSVDEITEIYSKYGASTKRGTDEQTGMLGLGCKSALTYAPTFTVTAVKHGVKVTVLVAKNAQGIGVMEVVDTVSTDEHNGVEIRIPTKHGNNLAEKANDFFRFWEKGTVLVNGKEPKHIEGIEIEPGILLSNDLDEDTLLMGGVAYPVREKNAYRYERPLGLNTTGKFLVTAPIGSVNFTPAREELHFTNKTRAYIESVKKGLKGKVEKKANADIAACQTHAEAFSEAQRWKKALGWNSSAWAFSYKGVAIPERFDGEFTVVSARYGYGRRGTHKTRSLSAEELASSLIITDFTADKPTPTQRKKADLYIEDNALDLDRLVFVKASTMTNQWVQINVVPLDTIKAVKIPSSPKVGTPGSTRTHPYDLLNEHGSTVETSAIKNKVVYGSPSDWKGDNSRLYMKNLYTYFHGIGYDVVVIAKNRWEKFERDFPTAVRIDRFLQNAYDTARDTLSESGLVLAKASDTDVEIARAVAKTGIVLNDPALVTFANHVTDATAIAEVKALNKIVQGAQNIGLSHRGWRSGSLVHMTSLTTTLSTSAATVYKGYGLCYRGDSRSDATHFALYINAVHAATNKEIS